MRSEEQQNDHSLLHTFKIMNIIQENFITIIYSNTSKEFDDRIRTRDVEDTVKPFIQSPLSGPSLLKLEKSQSSRKFDIKLNYFLFV